MDDMVSQLCTFSGRLFQSETEDGTNELENNTFSVEQLDNHVHFVTDMEYYYQLLGEKNDKYWGTRSFFILNKIVSFW